MKKATQLEKPVNPSQEELTCDPAKQCPDLFESSTSTYDSTEDRKSLRRQGWFCLALALANLGVILWKD